MPYYPLSQLALPRKIVLLIALVSLEKRTGTGSLDVVEESDDDIETGESSVDPEALEAAKQKYWDRIYVKKP